MGVGRLLGSAVPADVRLHDHAIVLLDEGRHAAQRLHDLLDQGRIVLALGNGQERSPLGFSFRGDDGRNVENGCCQACQPTTPQPVRGTLCDPWMISRSCQLLNFRTTRSSQGPFVCFTHYRGQLQPLSTAAPIDNRTAPITIRSVHSFRVRGNGGLAAACWCDPATAAGRCRAYFLPEIVRQYNGRPNWSRFCRLPEASPLSERDYCMTWLGTIAAQLAGLRFLAPAWRPAGFVVLGITGGMALFVFHTSRATSYLSDAPETCMNCHVMTTQYVTWQHSSHANVATCNDCHVPHTSLAAQYGFKAKDGLWRATVFTMRWEPQSSGCRSAGAGRRRQLSPLSRGGRCGRGPGRASGGRPALLGLPSGGAARHGPQPFGHAGGLPAATAGAFRADAAAHHRRAKRTTTAKRKPPMNTEQRRSPLPAWRGWALMIAALAATFVLGVLAASILQRREEARQRLPLRPIGHWETDAGKWGENYPREYEAYRKMAETTTRTKYGGATQRDYLEASPASVVLFAGYAFAQDYRQARGHVYAVEDVTKTKRVNAKTPATCWTCKSPDVPRLMASPRPAKFYAGKFDDFRKEITHPIGCPDCHEPNTMKLRITRPALREAFARQGKDIDQVSHQEMRTLVSPSATWNTISRRRGTI